MRLDLCTWMEVDAYLKQSDTIILTFGSNEQHGPLGLIGTDAICANEIALAAASQVDVLVAPPLTYTPAHFNMAFPGTISISQARLAPVLKPASSRTTIETGLGLAILSASKWDSHSSRASSCS